MYTPLVIILVISTSFVVFASVKYYGITGIPV